MSEQMFGERPAETTYERGHSDGEKFERERIISLLEDNAMTYHLVSINGKVLEQTAPLAAPLDNVIALIKGENK